MKETAPGATPRERGYRTLLEASADGFFEIDSFGRIGFANGALARMLGRSRFELEGENLSTLIEGSLDERFHELIRICAERPTEGRPLACKMKRVDGSAVYFEGSVAVVLDEDRRPRGLRAVVRPIATSASNAPAGAGKTLDPAAAQSAELARHAKELIHARNQFTTAMRLKAEFAARTGHEFRNPLSAILGMADLAIETNDARERRDYLEAVKASVRTLTDMIDSVLDFSSIQADRLKLEEIEFDFRETLETALRPLAAKAYEKGLDFAFEVRPEVEDHVIGDPQRLRQVLINLIDNAIRFTDEGHVTLRVELQERRDSLHTLLFEINDTGAGIEPDEQVRIYEALTRPDPDTSGGLGLPIAGQLVRTMGGRIWFESRPGASSRFFFTINVLSPSRVDEPAADVERLQGCKVLIADPSAFGRRACVDALAGAGVVALGFEDGQAAWRALEEAQAGAKPFDAAIVDAQLRSIDGFEILRRAVEDARLTGLVTILTCPAGRNDLIERGRRSNASAVLEKPVAGSKLLHKLAAIAPESWGPRAVAPGQSRPPLAASPRPQLIDRARLLERAGGDHGLLQELVGMFVADRPELMKLLRQAIDSRDAGALEQTAHKLKGTFATLAAEEAAAAAGRLESIGREGDFEAAPDALSELEAIAEAADRELRSIAH